MVVVNISKHIPYNSIFSWKWHNWKAKVLPFETRLERARRRGDRKLWRLTEESIKEFLEQE